MPSADPNKMKGTTSERAWRCLSCHLLLWIVLVTVAAGDLVTKEVVFRWLGGPADGVAGHGVAPRTCVVVDGLLELHTQYNRGAAMGILQGFGPVFVIAGVAALVLFVAFFARSHRRQWVLHTGIALVLAGASGNIYDRLSLGKVRDFIHITLRVAGHQVYPWIFNVADIALVVGVAVMVLSWLGRERTARSAARQAPGRRGDVRASRAAGRPRR